MCACVFVWKGSNDIIGMVTVKVREREGGERDGEKERERGREGERGRERERGREGVRERERGRERERERERWCSSLIICTNYVYFSS